MSVFYLIRWDNSQIESLTLVVTPFGIISLIIIFISGLYLMSFVVELKDYVKAWVLPNGQKLLLKHISILPV